MDHVHWGPDILRAGHPHFLWSVPDYDLPPFLLPPALYCVWVPPLASRTTLRGRLGSSGTGAMHGARRHPCMATHTAVRVGTQPSPFRAPDPAGAPEPSARSSPSLSNTPGSSRETHQYPNATVGSQVTKPSLMACFPLTAGWISQLPLWLNMALHQSPEQRSVDTSDVCPLQTWPV